MLLFVVLLLTSTLATGISGPVEQRPKALVRAPFNLRSVETQLAIKDAVEEAQSWYTSKLAYLIENFGGQTSPSVLNPALDDFFEVYCPAPYFKGFHGITGTGEIFTNISQVRELYKNQVIIAGPNATFNVVFYKSRINFYEQDQPRNRRSVYANMTASNSHHIRVSDGQGGMNFMFVAGYYKNQWRIDENGNMCISRFYDAFLKVFNIDYTLFATSPWDIK